MAQSKQYFIKFEVQGAIKSYLIEARSLAQALAVGRILAAGNQFTVVAV